MSYAQSVTIGPRFFKKAFNDYSNRYWAFARELMQNSIDCGSRNVSIAVQEYPDLDETRACVVNDGEPMARDTLVNKLLSLGESGKDFQGAVGGFGKAKEVLYFAHKCYEIRSGSLRVVGSGAGYDMTETPSFTNGTTSLVSWDGLHGDALAGQFGRFVHLCGTGSRVKFTLNGEAVRPRVHPGELERTLDHDGQPWAEVRLSKAEPGLVVVRVGGVPMFSARCDYKGTIALELLGTSAQRLTSNRDGLRYPYSNQLSEFLTTVAVDKRTAFLLEKAEYKRIAGGKLGRKLNARPATVTDDRMVGWVTAARADVDEPTGGAGILVNVVSRVEAPRAGLLGHEFIVKNCVRRAVPPQYDPDDLAFSDYAHWLVRAWSGCLLELYDLHEIDECFSVGFVFSDRTEAESERSAEYGQVYYLNPCHVTRKGHTRRFKRASRFRVLAAAAHEFVHGALGESYHGEDYANKLTEVMATVMRNSRRFTRHLG